MSRIEIAMEKAGRNMQRKDTAESRSLEADVLSTTIYPNRFKFIPTNPYLVNIHTPYSQSAEEYRKLKSALVKMTIIDNDFKNTVLVTSAVPSEGKSLTALNLAISLAQELDHTVLLVDADLRKPTLHKFFEIEQGIGLSNVLCGEAKIEDAILATGVGKLSIMRAGANIDNPAELFSSAKMKGLIDELKTRYPDRYLIFDSSPVLPFAETRSLAHLVDGVLFVIMERRASQANIIDAIDSLKGCHMFGFVYNAVQFENSSSNSYYDFNQIYSYK